MIQTNSRLYKVYEAEEVDNLNLALYQDSIRYSNDKTQVILEFIDAPHANTITLSNEEARTLMNTAKWQRELPNEL